MKTSRFLIVFLIALFSFTSCGVDKEITYDPQKDAETAIEILKKSSVEEYAQYSQEVSTKYYAKFGIPNGSDKFNEYMEICSKEIEKGNLLEKHKEEIMKSMFED